MALQSMKSLNRITITCDIHAAKHGGRLDVQGQIVLTCCARWSLVLFGAGAGEAATAGVLTRAAMLTGQAGAR